MASTRERFTKDGKRYFEIRVRRGRGSPALSENWYVPDGWSEKVIQRELTKVASEFERKVKAGEVVSRAEQKEIDALEAAEAAKLKTVKQYAEGVFMPTKETTMSENGISNYKMFLDKHILPHIGSVLLVDVTPAILTKRILDYQKEGYAHASAVKLYNILNGIFEMAFMDDSVPMNPMLKVKRPVQGKNEQAIDESEKALTVEQLNSLLEYMEHEPLKWRVFVSLAADTGMRRGELCGLYWSDIDKQSRAVTVKWNLQYSPDKGIYETSPKNGKARKVDIGQETLDLLNQLKKEQASTCLSKYVFTQNGSPEPMNPQSPTRYFSKLGDRCGIPNFHPHLLRHTSASVAITNGADVVSVSQRLGHSDTAVTLRMYAHANEESIRRAGQVVRDALKVNKG
ncbi:MAG: site-specific integrase [Clostridia bacterium]|nr:site-specific integrase [Clostridia bacterium]